MKTAIYIEDGVVQLVLTPENEFEKNAISAFSQKPCSVQIKEGSFYDCNGGWTRQTDTTGGFGVVEYSIRSHNNDKSLIIRVEPTEVPAGAPILPIPENAK